jgi:hypothetical protein
MRIVFPVVWCLAATFGCSVAATFQNHHCDAVEVNIAVRLRGEERGGRGPVSGLAAKVAVGASAFAGQPVKMGLTPVDASGGIISGLDNIELSTRVVSERGVASSVLVGSLLLGLRFWGGRMERARKAAGRPLRPGA